MMRLRQVALVTDRLAPTVDEVRETLRLGAPFRDPGVEIFGLENAVLPIGDTFLEILAPLRADCAGARHLARRGGPGGYMAIVQTDDLAAARRRVGDAGARIVFDYALDDIATLHLHPRDTGGALLSIDAAVPAASWRWAGPGWQERVDRRAVDAILGIEIECDDPAVVAARWSALVARPVTVGASAEPELANDARGIANDASEVALHECEILLDGSFVRFVPRRDTRGEGIHTVVLRATSAGAPPAPVVLCGTRFVFVTPTSAA